MTQQHSLIISIVIAAFIVGGAILYTGSNSGGAIAQGVNSATPYPTPLPQVAQLPPAGGCGIPRQ